jgi:Zn-dependent protease with chaperone function
MTRYTLAERGNAKIRPFGAGNGPESLWPYHRHMSQMLCSAALAALALAAALPANAAAPANACAEARAQDPTVGAAITDPRVLAALHDAYTCSGLGTPVVPCWLNMPFVNATVDDVGSFYYVAVTRALVAEMTDIELRAVLGHEIAHIVLGHRTARFELTHHRSAAFEATADALSALWFGNDAMLSVLTKLRADAAKLPDAAQRRVAIRQIDERVRDLTAVPPSIAGVFGGMFRGLPNPFR